MSACPGEATLRLIGSDALGDVTYAAIEQHVEGCTDCKVVLERLAHRRGEANAVSPGSERLPCIPGFEIQRVLEQGGAGVVYLATETGLNRPVALKVLPGGLGPEASAAPRRRWLREAQAISSVRHPNVVPLYDYGEADGWLFLVLEYIPGGSLKRRLTEPLPPRAAAGLSETIARAVEHLHTHGLIHLDLKPSNILLDGERDASWDRVIPRISDFGLALSNDGAPGGAGCEAWQGVRGTSVLRSSPEQATASPPGIQGAADIHALGAILYELLTGRPPFQGASTLETLDQVRGQNPVSPRRLIPKLPRDLETIALKCLEKNPSRRYASAEAMADDLRRWLDGRPIAVRPVSGFEKSWSWCRRHPSITALASTLLMTFSVSFLTIVVLWRHAEAERNRTELERTRAERETRHAELERSSADRERLRAEADYQAARAALAEVLDLGIAGLRQNIPRDNLVERLQAARERMIELSTVRSNDSEILRHCAVVDLALGEDLARQGDWGKSQPLYVESLLYWEKLLHKDPHDLFAQRHRWETSIYLAKAVENQGNVEESVRLWDRAVAWGESLLPLGSDAEVQRLVDSRVSLARVLGQTGNPDRAMTILEANLRMIGDVSTAKMDVSTEKMNANVTGWLRWNHREMGALLERFSPGELEHLAAKDWADRVAALLCSSRHTQSAIVNEGTRDRISADDGVSRRQKGSVLSR